MTWRGGKTREAVTARTGRKGGAGPTSPEQAQTPALQSKPTWRRRLITLGLCLLSPLLLNFAFAPFDAWPLGFVGLVPLVVGLALSPTRRWGFFSAWLAGLVFWGVVVYWLTWITPGGYVAGILYGTLYWLVPGMLIWAALRRNHPMWLVLPLVWVTLELIRAYAQDLYLGITFPWFALAHSQYRVTALVQIADVTGYYGVSFLVAMVNGLAAEFALAGIRRRRNANAEPDREDAMPALCEPARPGRRLVIGSTVVVASLVGAMGYGFWQLSRDTRTAGPIIGIVQRAYPISLSGRMLDGKRVTPEEILDSHLEGTREFLSAESRPDLVIWPETMLPNSLNREMTHLDIDSLGGDYLRSLAARYGGPDAWDAAKYGEPRLREFLKRVLQEGKDDGLGGKVLSRKQLAQKVYDMSARLGCPILAGGAGVYRNDKPLFRKDEWLVRNAALWFDPNDPNAPSYAKRHLVPFSEAVPFKHTWLGLYKLLRSFVPEVMEQLDPGPDNTVFVLSRPGGTWRVVSPICYEGTIGQLCRNLVYEDGRKRADIMANLSNDGWFVNPWTHSKHGSTEQSQHLSHYVYRAVENRVPVVRAVNTGISASIDSNGRIVAELTDGRRKTMISGILLLDGARGGPVEYLPGHGPKVLVDERVSWYSRVGDVFAIAVAIAAGVWTVGIFASRRRRKRLCK